MPIKHCPTSSVQDTLCIFYNNPAIGLTLFQIPPNSLTLVPDIINSIITRSQSYHNPLLAVPNSRHN